MPSLSLTLQVGLAVAFAGATVGASRHFSLKQARSVGSQVAPAVDVYYTCIKYGAVPPAELQASFANLTSSTGAATTRKRNQAGTASVQHAGNAWVAPVGIGVPPQTLQLELDTGSADFWVFSSLTPSYQIAGQTPYRMEQSRTARQMRGATWYVEYTDHSYASGLVWKDRVNIAGIEVDQAVEVAEHVAAPFTGNSRTDGLVGLAFDLINSVEPAQEKTWLSNVLPHLALPLFCVDAQGETFDFGWIDHSKYQGTIAYTEVDPSDGYWAFTASGYQIGGGPWAADPIVGIADTGCTLTYLPTSIVEAYYSQIPSARFHSFHFGYVFDCKAPIPDLTIGIGASRITIPARLLLYTAVHDGTMCYGGIQDSAPVGQVIFGGTTLLAAYVVHDRSTHPPKLGWAQKPIV